MGAVPVRWALAGAAGAAFFVVLALTPVVERFACRRGWLDRPGGRHQHTRAVPRLGGVALFAGLVAGCGVLWAAGLGQSVAPALAGASVVWLVGLWDDLRGLRPAAKLAGQVAAALVSVALGLRVEFVTAPHLWKSAPAEVLHLGWSSYPLTVLWLVSLSNAVNLLDGLDGLAAGVVAIAAVPTAVAALGRGFVEAAALLAVLGAGCLAFLRYNFHPARIFMGDSGALLLGFTFGAAAVAGTAKGPAAMTLLVPVLSLGVPLLDTAWAVVRRLRAGRSVAEADAGHLHHRLLNGGRRQVWQVVLLLYAVTAALGAIAAALPPRGRLGSGMALSLLGTACVLAVLMRASRRPAAAGAAAGPGGSAGFGSGQNPGSGGGVGPAAGKVDGRLGSSGHAGVRHPAGGYQARPGHPHPGGFSRL